MRISDWSSDVCSSDLHGSTTPTAFPVNGPLSLACSKSFPASRPPYRLARPEVACSGRPGITLVPTTSAPRRCGDRKSVVLGKRVAVRVDLGGRRKINKNKNKTDLYVEHIYILVED